MIVSVLFTKPTGGLSSARNEGLGIAMGARIAFVDSDDWIDSEMLATMNRWMDEQSAVDVVMCGTIKNYENGREQCIDGDLPQRVFTSDQALHNFLYRSNRMASAVWNKLFDATLFKDDEGKTVVLFPEGLDNEDTICWRIYTERCVESISILVASTIIASVLDL